MIVNAQKQVAEVAIHEELLNHGVHVADIAEILHAGIASGGALVYLCGIGDLDGSDAGINGGESLSYYLVS